MDKTCIIWEAPEAKPYPSVRADFFEGAVRHVDWRRDSTNLATCGFEKSVRFLDVATARCVSQVCTPEYVTCAKFHPEHDHLLVGGMFSSGLFCWDVRANQLVRRYNSDLGMIHDLIFPAADPTHQQFLSCPDVTKRSAVDKAIFAWDFNSAAPMFYQIYHEAYTCTALRQHPRSGQICAQSSAGYIIVLENKPPYKLNRSKRFEGHSMSGLRVGFDVASDGKTVFSGSSTGDCVAYNWGTAKLAWRWKAHVANCSEVACHPHTRNQVVTASSDGTVRLWDTTNMGRSVHEPT
jgi:WD repeat-containing protein 25